MKRVKFLSIVLSIVIVLLLQACDNREYYIEQLEELDRNDLVALNRWLDDNEESMEDLFELVDLRVDLAGNELDLASQVLGLDLDYFERWSFDLVDDTITFLYIWDYEGATAVPEEIINPLAADNERLANWISDAIPIFEEIDVDEPLMFITTIGGFITGTRSTLEGISASDYVTTQIKNVISFLEEANALVAQSFDDEELDLVEVRDIIIATLTEMKNLFLES